MLHGRGDRGAKSRARRSLPAALAVLLMAATGGGCSAVLSPKSPRAIREFSVQLNLHGDPLTLHLAAPRTPSEPSMPLVLYASGDGGWFGAAVGMFRTIVSRGLPVVGFSTKRLMRIEHRVAKPLSARHITESYQQIIDAARTRLGLSPDAPVVLTGWSRGASLAVLVASSHEVDPDVIGLVAIGLAADEQLDLEGGSDNDGGTADVVNGVMPARSVAMYPLLSRIPLRLVVIQASGDGYLPAARARALFGSDSATKRLVAVDAHNHRFSGGESRLAAALSEALDWASATRK